MLRVDAVVDHAVDAFVGTALAERPAASVWSPALNLEPDDRHRSLPFPGRSPIARGSRDVRYYARACSIGAGGRALPPLITLTTDFGRRDPYVAAIKGVLLSACPDARVVDLTHEIAPQDVLEGALFLAAALPHFPAGTVHVAVVDPGVGGDRRAIAVSAGGQRVVCPDNGLLTLFAREQSIDEARQISNPAFMRDDISATFHGRDVFAPAAARLACGAPLEEVGPVAQGVVQLDIPTPRKTPGRVIGEVMHIDRYGNAISNVHRSDLGGATVREVLVAGRRLGALRRTFADAAQGEPLAYFESTGHLALAVNRGDASAVLGLRRGDAIELLIER